MALIVIDNNNALNWSQSIGRAKISEVDNEINKTAISCMVLEWNSNWPHLKRRTDIEELRSQDMEENLFTAIELLLVPEQLYPKEFSYHFLKSMICAGSLDNFRNRCDTDLGSRVIYKNMYVAIDLINDDCKSILLILFTGTDNYSQWASDNIRQVENESVLML